MGYGLIESAPTVHEKSLIRLMKAGLDLQRCRTIMGINLTDLHAIAERYGYGKRLITSVAVKDADVAQLRKVRRGLITSLHRVGMDLIDISQYLSKDINIVYEYLATYCEDYSVYVDQVKRNSSNKNEDGYRRRCIVSDPALESHDMDKAVIRMIKKGLRHKSLVTYVNLSEGDRKRIMAKYRRLTEQTSGKKKVVPVTGRPRTRPSDMSEAILTKIAQMIDIGFDIIDIQDYLGMNANHVLYLVDLLNEKEQAAVVCQKCNTVMLVKEAPTMHICSACAVKQESAQIAGKIHGRRPAIVTPGPTPLMRGQVAGVAKEIRPSYL